MRSGKELEHQRQQIRSRLALAFQRRALEEGMTQAELSRLTGASSATVNEWFKSAAVPDGVMLARIAEALKVNGHWLLTGQGSMEPPGKGEVGMDEAFRAGAKAVIGRLGQVIAQLRDDFAASSSQRGAKVLEQERRDAESARSTPGRRGSTRREAS